MKGKGLPRATRITYAVVIFLCLCLGFGSVMFKGFIDFPCFVYYNPANQCVETGDSYPRIQEDEKIQVFLDTRQLGFGGAGCHTESSSSDILEFETPASVLRFERVGDTLFLNEKELKPGGEYKFTRFWNINPWTVYSIELTNVGLVPVCGGNAPSQFYVIGSYGNKISLLKASLTLVVCLALVYFITNRTSIKKRSVEGSVD